MKNLNELAALVTCTEGKAQSLSIAQVKEVIRILCSEMYNDSELVAAMITNGKKQAKKRGKR